MKLDGKDGVLQHFLMDVDNRLGDLTLPSYTQRLKLLVQLLGDLCSVTEIEQVETKHLRQCVQHLLTVPVYDHGRRTERDDNILSISTVMGYMRVWKAFFSWCYQEDLINANPASRLKFPKAPKKITSAFTDEHIEKMIAVCDTSTHSGFRDYVILLLLLDTGIRLAEMAGLTLDDIHDGYIKVTGKGRKDREIGIHPDMSKLLWKYVQKHRHIRNENERALFVGTKGAMTGPGISYVIKRIKKDSGLSDIKLTPHVFRHTHSKMYMENGGDLFKLSRELGHSSVQITKIYLEDFGSTEARKDHNAYTPLSFIQLKKHTGKKGKDDVK
ncbi:MAG: tyrosine-type recombinase/integrase [Ktedonobacteraceae bacterium]|nr:tyrosine-type recombinase/integrase [Ktedonobacteraceae bacterium]